MGEKMKEKEKDDSGKSPNGEKDQEWSWFPGLAFNVGCGLIMLALAAGISISIIKGCVH